MILLMTLVQQFRRPAPRPIPTERWSLKATVAAFWAAALLVVVTSFGVLAAVGWVLLAPPEAQVLTVEPARANQAQANQVTREEQEI